MFGKFVVVILTFSADALELKKATEAGCPDTGCPGNAIRVGLPSFEGLCLFGMCIHNKKDYQKSKTFKDDIPKQIEELKKKKEELEQWKVDEEERKKFEEAEKQNMEEWKKREAEAATAQTCQCNFSCGGKHDGSVCYRTCCNNEFGGDPAKAGHGNPMTEGRNAIKLPFR